MKRELFLPASKILDIDIERGEGVYLFDKKGKSYLDFLAGMGVNALGYRHPKICEAVKKQLNRNLHLFGYFIQDVQEELAELVLENTSLDRIFYTNSGTEAIEGALKVVKKYGKKHGYNEIICFVGAFHGRSLGALSVTAQPQKQKPFEPLVPGILAIEPTVEAFRKAVTQKTSAVFVEPILGEGGVKPLPFELLKEIKKMKKKGSFKLVLDEIQTGVGRTGFLYYYQKIGLKPDIVVSAKMLGGGLPLGAILLTEEMANIFSVGEHGSTFGGNPLSCSTGIVVLKELIHEGLLKHVCVMGNYFRKKLNQMKEKIADIIDIRVEGLMIGIDIRKDAFEVMKNCVANGLIVNATQGKTIRFLPPLILSDKNVDDGLSLFEISLKETSNKK